MWALPCIHHISICLGYREHSHIGTVPGDRAGSLKHFYAVLRRELMKYWFKKHFTEFISSISQILLTTFEKFCIQFLALAEFWIQICIWIQMHIWIWMDTTLEFFVSQNFRIFCIFGATLILNIHPIHTVYYCTQQMCIQSEHSNIYANQEIFHTIHLLSSDECNRE